MPPMAATRTRLTAWVESEAAGAAPHLLGHEQQQWLARLESEYDTIREAVEWSLTADLCRLRIDATKVSFCDSVGVGCLLDAACKCRERNVPLELAASSRLPRTLGLVGLPSEDGSAAPGSDGLVTELSAALSDIAAERIAAKSRFGLSAPRER